MRALQPHDVAPVDVDGPCPVDVEGQEPGPQLRELPGHSIAAGELDEVGVLGVNGARRDQQRGQDELAAPRAPVGSHDAIVRELFSCAVSCRFLSNAIEPSAPLSRLASRGVLRGASAVLFHVSTKRLRRVRSSSSSVSGSAPQSFATAWPSMPAGGL